jgi:hypothetical protein
MAFIFVKDEKNQFNKENKGKNYWRPVMVFYAKTTAWVIFPLILALLLNKWLIIGTEGKSSLFFALLMAGFGITCFGIYKEIKKYKKDLDKK